MINKKDKELLEATIKDLCFVVDVLENDNSKHTSTEISIKRARELASQARYLIYNNPAYNFYNHLRD